MERTVTVDGARLVLDDDGAGPPIVCLHAIAHDAGDFAGVRARFADRHRVLAIDWPGHGRSPRDVVPTSAARYAVLLAGALDALGVDDAVVVGNSIGGAAALRYAARRPERVRGLVLENPGGLAPVDDALARAVLAGMAAFFAAGARGVRWFAPAFAAYYRTVLQRAAAAPTRRRIVARGRAMAPVLAEAWRSFADPEADVRGCVGAVRCPVLFVWAVRDPVVSLGRSLPAIRGFASARIVRCPAGHAPHLETPERFADALAAFLGGLPPWVSASRTAAP
jgi:pimeloyl-ACP methyl ester carboxylesterase